MRSSKVNSYTLLKRMLFRRSMFPELQTLSGEEFDEIIRLIDWRATAKVVTMIFIGLTPVIAGVALYIQHGYHFVQPLSIALGVGLGALAW